MDLQELKALLKITDSKDDAFLQLALDSCLDYARAWTNNDFEDGIPASVKLGVAILVSTMLSGDGVAAPVSGSNIKSETIDGISVTYFSPSELGEAAESGGSDAIAEKYFKPYRKIRLL